MFRNGPIANNPAPALYYVQSVLEPDMANVGWVKVSSNIQVNTANASNAWNWDVWCSPNTINQIGKDWFIALGVDIASNANIICTVFEQWNGYGTATSAGANQAAGYPPGCTQNAAGTSYNPIGNSWCNVNSSTLPLSPNSNCGYLICGIAAAASNQLSSFLFNYYHSVTIDRVITMSSNVASANSGHAYYLGTYDSFMSNTQDPVPIVAMNFDNYLSSTSFINGPVGSAAIAPNTIHTMFTREPGFVPSATTQNWGGGIGGGLNTPQSWLSTINVPEFYSNRFLFSRAVLIGKFGIAGNGQRGILKDIYVTNAIGVRGDTVGISINGVNVTVTWMTNNQTNGQITSGTSLPSIVATMAQV